MTANFGMVGLGTMGRNLAMNIADNGFAICGYDKDENQRARFLEEGVNQPISVAATAKEFIEKIASPRAIILLVPAGKIVDIVLEELTPLLSPGDIIIDGGNSHFTDTERRYSKLKDSKLHFFGMGVSGGEEGARRGPSMMPGGNKESYELVKPMLEKIAAKTSDGTPCVDYMGHGAAGHYVKMVHNGIEYAVMELIAEVYGVLKNCSFSNEELHQTFTEWNQSNLQSYLIEITADIFTKKDDKSNNALVDMILDKAKQKGTGLWTSQSALDLNVPIPTIDVSVSMRYLSALKDERVQLAANYPFTQSQIIPINKEKIKAIAYEALQLAILAAYTQGLNLILTASKNFGYEVEIKRAIKVWRAGCIIRSLLLNDLYEAFDKNSSLTNILASKVFNTQVQNQQSSLKELVKTALEVQVSAAAFTSALFYIQSYTANQLPSNLIQAQRDYFGAHTYERIDESGVFHTEWEA